MGSQLLLVPGQQWLLPGMAQPGRAGIQCRRASRCEHQGGGRRLVLPKLQRIRAARRLRVAKSGPAGLAAACTQAQVKAELAGAAGCQLAGALVRHQALHQVGGGGARAAAGGCNLRAWAGPSVCIGAQVAEEQQQRGVCWHVSCIANLDSRGGYGWRSIAACGQLPGRASALPQHAELGSAKLELHVAQAVAKLEQWGVAAPVTVRAACGVGKAGKVGRWLVTTSSESELSLGLAAQLALAGLQMQHTF